MKNDYLPIKQEPSQDSLLFDPPPDTLCLSSTHSQGDTTNFSLLPSTYDTEFLSDEGEMDYVWGTPEVPHGFRGYSFGGSGLDFAEFSTITAYQGVSDLSGSDLVYPEYPDLLQREGSMTSLHADTFA
jgi:hypothetical protein